MKESTCIIDFETYSKAGWELNSQTGKWAIKYGGTNSLSLIGTHVYATHPSTRILCLAFQFPEENTIHLWVPGQTFPKSLITYIKEGKLIEAHNAAFEYNLWNYCLAPAFDLPLLDIKQLRCSMAKAKTYGLPSSLKDIGNILPIKDKKDEKGEYLIKLFSLPQIRSKIERIFPYERPEEFKELCDYCIQDVKTQRAISTLMPDLLPTEQKLWEMGTIMNTEGLFIDAQGVHNCVKVIEKTKENLISRLPKLTNGKITDATQNIRIVKWIREHGFRISDLTKDTVKKFLKRKNLPSNIREVLKIRQALGFSSVKKLYAILPRLKDQRIYDNYKFYGADTGRFTGTKVQLQNIPRTGHKIYFNSYFKKYHDYKVKNDSSINIPVKWDNTILEYILHNPQDIIEWRSPLNAVSGALRGLIIAPKGYDYICSDYSSIEAVVLAMLAGEQWREKLFRKKEDLYIASGSLITGIPKEKITKDHKARAIGKLAELASGYQGALGAWKRFGADEILKDEEILEAVRKWRLASPRIVALWGGQYKKINGNWVKVYHGLEGAVIQALLNPGKSFEYRYLKYTFLPGKVNVLCCVLPSGRYLFYQDPWLTVKGDKFQINYMREDRNIVGHWVKSELYGGKLANNATQATARDIFTMALLRIHKRGYKIVLHTHDEIMIEVPEGTCSVEKLENLMEVKESWFQDWPIRASGGWRGKRYRK